MVSRIAGRRDKAGDSLPGLLGFLTGIDRREIRMSIHPCQKNKYRLWYEFLKRSSDYKELCNWNKAVLSDSGIPIPDKFVHPKRQSCGMPIVSVFGVFGDVHDRTFEDWWTHRNEKVLFVGDKRVNIVRSNGVRLMNELSNTFDKFQTVKSTCICIEVDIASPCSDEELCKNVMDIIKQFRNDEEGKFLQAVNRVMEGLIPSTVNVKSDAMERYLKVYDLRIVGKKRWKDVIELLSPQADSKDSNVLRAYQRDLEKAKKIIQSAERGIFPPKSI